MLINQLQDRIWEGLSSTCRNPDQNYARTLHVGDKRQPPKVLIFSQQDSTLLMRFRHQIRVEGLSLLLAGRKDLVACCSKSSNNDEVTTFIGQEPHLSSFGTQAVDAFVSDGISGVG